MDGGTYSIHLLEEQKADGSSIWTAEHPELPGCNATGANETEAVHNLEHAREAWMKTASHLGIPIPPGHETEVFQVKFSRRWPVDPASTTGQSATEDLQFRQDLQFAAR